MDFHSRITSELRWDPKPVLVTLGCLFGAAYSSFLLLRDLHNHGARNGDPMAKLERVDQKVRLKPAQSFVWESIGANEKLYLKDSIQTAPGGAASIRFNDGTMLEIGENSLIIIDSIENLSLNFLHGSVVVRSQSGDSKITMGKDGKAKVEQLPVHLLSPEPLSRFFVLGNSAKNLEFAWTANSNPGQALPDSLELSTDRNFQEPNVRTFPVAEGSKSVSAQLHAGKYFWRVLAQKKPVTEPSRFSIESVGPLKPLFPGPQDRVVLFGQENTVQFRWTSPSEDFGDSSHRIEIASDPDFRNIVAKQEISSASGVSNLKGLREGKYYWRIASHYSGISVKSAVEKFQVTQIADASIELNEPEDHAVIDSTKGIRFDWHSEASSVQYRWQLRPKTIPGKVQSADLSSQTRIADLPGPGIYQWRVQAFYNSQPVGESAWRELTALSGKITLSAPAPMQEIYYWTDPAPFEFKWEISGKGELDHYVLEVASNPDFKNSISVSTPTARLASSQLSLTPGDLFWRVKGMSSSNELVKMSPVQQFKYGSYPLLRAPASAKPETGSVINPLEMEKNPAISWSSVPDAQSYDLTVKQADKVVLRKNVKQTEVELKGLQPGKYSYTLQAVDRAQRKGEPLPERAFEINFGNTLGAPEALSPEVQ